MAARNATVMAPWAARKARAAGDSRSVPMFHQDGKCAVQGSGDEWAVPGSNGRPPACKARAAAAVCRFQAASRCALQHWKPAAAFRAEAALPTRTHRLAILVHCRSHGGLGRRYRIHGDLRNSAQMWRSSCSSSSVRAFRECLGRMRPSRGSSPAPQSCSPGMVSATSRERWRSGDAVAACGAPRSRSLVNSLPSSAAALGRRPC